MADVETPWALFGEAVAFCNWLTARELGATEQVYVVSGERDARVAEVHQGQVDHLRGIRGGSWDLVKVMVNPTDPELKRTLDAAWVVYGLADLPSGRRPDHGFRPARSGG